MPTKTTILADSKPMPCQPLQSDDPDYVRASEFVEDMLRYGERLDAEEEQLLAGRATDDTRTRLAAIARERVNFKAGLEIAQSRLATARAFAI